MKQEKGFTLIEVAMAIVVIAIMAAIIVPRVGGNLRSKAIGSEAVGMLGVIETACRLYVTQYGQAPQSLTDLVSAGFVSMEQLRGRYISESDISNLLGDEKISMDSRGLGVGCGTVHGVTICKIDKGGYSISGIYNP